MGKVIIILLVIFNILIFTDFDIFPEYSKQQAYTVEDGKNKENYPWLGKSKGSSFEQEMRYMSRFLDKMREKPGNEKIRILLLSLTLCNVILVIKYLRRPKSQ